MLRIYSLRAHLHNLVCKKNNVKCSLLSSDVSVDHLNPSSLKLFLCSRQFTVTLSNMPRQFHYYFSKHKIWVLSSDVSIWFWLHLHLLSKINWNHIYCDQTKIKWDCYTGDILFFLFQVELKQRFFSLLFPGCDIFSLKLLNPKK